MNGINFVKDPLFVGPGKDSIGVGVNEIFDIPSCTVCRNDKNESTVERKHLLPSHFWHRVYLSLFLRCPFFSKSEPYLTFLCVKKEYTMMYCHKLQMAVLTGFPILYDLRRYSGASLTL